MDRGTAPDEQVSAATSRSPVAAAIASFVDSIAPDVPVRVELWDGTVLGLSLIHI